MLTHNEPPSPPSPIVANPKLVFDCLHVIPVVPETFNLERGVVVPIPTLPEVGKIVSLGTPFVIKVVGFAAPAPNILA